MPRPFGHPAVLFAAALAAAVPAHAARQDGLALYLNFDNEAEPLRNSVTKSALTAEKVGEGLDLSFTEGRFGRAALFTNSPAAPNVSDWAINLGKLGSLYEGSFTVACWVRYASAHNGVVFGNKEAAEVMQPGFLLSASSAARATAAGDGRPVINVPGDSSAAGDAWHHWALVVDRPAESVTFYLDGKSVLSRPLPAAGTKLDGGRNTMIGAGADGRNGAKLAVDDVGVWSRALTAKELADLGSGQGKRIPEPGVYGLAAGGAGLVAALAARRRRAKRA